MPSSQVLSLRSARSMIGLSAIPLSIIREDRRYGEARIATPVAPRGSDALQRVGYAQLLTHEVDRLLVAQATYRVLV
jgi:hypothetical protein